MIPDRVAFTGHVGEKLSQIVVITPESGKPFKIIKVSAMKGTDLQYELKEEKRFDKKVYLLTVTNTRQEPGRYFDRISLKTDSKIIGTISIMVSANLKPAVTQEKPTAAPKPQ